jgi:hypothetical protein
MKARYRLIRRSRRGGASYCVDTEAGKRSSLGVISGEDARNSPDGRWAGEARLVDKGQEGIN